MPYKPLYNSKMSDIEKSTSPSEETKDKIEKVHETQWQLNEPIDVDAYEDKEINSFSNVLPVPKIMKIDSLAPSVEPKMDSPKSKSLKKRRKHATHTCKSLGIETKYGLDKVKQELRQRIAKANPHPDLKDPKASSCRTIHIKNLPKWHQAFHVQSLIWLTSDFDIEGTNYYIDMYKDAIDKTTGECLIRFIENKDCIQVFKDLQGNFKTNNGQVVQISLDLGHKISRTRSVRGVNTNEKLQKFFQTCMQHKEKLRATQSCKIKTESDEDDIEFVELQPIKTEVIIDSDEDDDNEESPTLNDEIKEVPAKDEKNNQSGNMNEDSDDNDCFDISDNDCKKVIVKNLPLEKTESECIKSLLENAGVADANLTYKCQPITCNVNPTGDCLLTFESSEDAEKVCNLLNGAVLNTHFIEAAMAKGFNIRKENITVQDIRRYELKRKRCEDDKDENEEPSANKKPRTAVEPMVNLKNMHTEVHSRDTSKDYFGLSTKYLTKKLRVQLASLHNIVIVSNLLEKVDENKLREVFSLAGDVKNVKFLPENPLSERQAEIEFDHPLEAVQSVSMFNCRPLYGKPMVVKMHRYKPRPLPEGLVGCGPGLGPMGEILRGLRTRDLKRQIDDYLVDLGLIKKDPVGFVAPFKFVYTKSKNPVIATNSTAVSTNDNNNTTNEETPKAVNNASKNDDKIPESTLLAIQALATVLKSQGLIPQTTECTNLEDILKALTKKARIANANLQSNSNTNLNAPGASGLDYGNVSATTLQNDQIPRNITPNQANALTQSIQQLMQCMSSNQMPPNMQASMAQDFKNGNFNQMMTNLNQVIGNMQPNVPGPNLNQHGPMVGPAPEMLPRPPVLYDDQPPPGWDESPNMGQFQPNPHPNSFAHNPFPPAPTMPNIPPQPYMPHFNQNVPMYANPIPPVPPPLRLNLKEVPTQPVLPSKPVMPSRPVVLPQETSKPPIISKDKDKMDYLHIKKSEMLVFKNLPPSVTKEALTTKMREVGVVLFSEMTGRGRAFVRFKQPEDAERCIRLFHHSKVDGQVIDVTYL